MSCQISYTLEIHPLPGSGYHSQHYNPVLVFPSLLCSKLWVKGLRPVLEAHSSKAYWPQTDIHPISVYWASLWHSQRWFPWKPQGPIGAPECHWHLHSLDDHQSGWTATLRLLLEYPQLDRNLKVNKKTGRSYWTRNRDDGEITNDSPDGSCPMTTPGMSILLPGIFGSAKNFIHPTQERGRLPSQRSLPT